MSRRQKLASMTFFLALVLFAVAAFFARELPSSIGAAAAPDASPRGNTTLAASSVGAEQASGLELMFSGLRRHGVFGEGDARVEVLEGTRREDGSRCIVSVETDTWASACMAPRSEESGPLFLETWAEANGVPKTYRLVGLSPPNVARITAVDSTGAVRVAERAGSAFSFAIPDDQSGKGARILKITGRGANDVPVYVRSLPDG